jgi:hypothetical protein
MYMSFNDNIAVSITKLVRFYAYVKVIHSRLVDTLNVCFITPISCVHCIHASEKLDTDWLAIAVGIQGMHLVRLQSLYCRCIIQVIHSVEMDTLGAPF